MEFSSSNVDNPVAAMSRATSKNSKDENTPTPAPSHSSEENGESDPEFNSSNSNVVVLTISPGPDPLRGNGEMGNHEQYGCKYCDKKFNNKQAIGGHQNAHKLERSMEKAAHEAGAGANYLRENHQFHYFGELATQPRLPLLQASFTRPPFFARPVFPMGGMTYSPAVGGMTFLPLQVPGFNRVCMGWNVAVPGIPLAGSPFNMRYPASNSQVLMGSPSARPLLQNPQAVAVAVPPSRIVPATFGVPNNNQDEEVDETELDLSLRL